MLSLTKLSIIENVNRTQDNVFNEKEIFTMNHYSRDRPFGFVRKGILTR